VLQNLRGIKVRSIIFAADGGCDVIDGAASLLGKPVSVKNPASKAVAVKAVPKAVH